MPGLSCDFIIAIVFGVYIAGWIEKLDLYVRKMNSHA